MNQGDPIELRSRLSHIARQHPLLETNPSLRAIERCADFPRPGAVFTGVGLASGQEVSRALPMDVLGLLLSAEQVRRAVDAEHLIVLVADSHALAEGAPSALVRARCRAYESSLRRIATRCGLSAMRVRRASELHADRRYQEMLRQVRGRARGEANEYVKREVADMAHLDRVHGGIVKVGWALQSSPRGAERDERFFDGCFRRWMAREVGLVYAKAGRAFDDAHQKMPPYIETQRQRRICLEPTEQVATKLSGARANVSHSTWRGVRKHLTALCRTYGKVVRPLSGALEERLQAIIDDVLIDDMPRPAPESRLSISV
jgi:hypothetical protein